MKHCARSMSTHKYMARTMVVLLWTGASLAAMTAVYHMWDRSSGVHTEEFSFQNDNSSQELNLSDFIWQESLDLLPQAWSTTFIAGVVNGLMNPNFYGFYILQDALYCRRVGQLWEQLANNASVHDEIREYANGSVFGFQECSTLLFDAWNIKDDKENDYGVIIREPVMDYVAFIEHAMVGHAPNMLIATYACLKLWNQLTSDLLPIVGNSTTNPYATWVYDNRGSGSSMRRQATQMNEWDKNYQWYNWIEARSLFRSAMMNEINFFEQGGNSSTY